VVSGKGAKVGAAFLFAVNYNLRMDFMFMYDCVRLIIQNFLA
jgi:hypothetical protein